MGLYMVDKETKAKLKEREKQVKEELKHIPRGNTKQNEFKKTYKVIRMYNFEKNPHATKEDALTQAFGGIVDDRYKYDQEFFKFRKYSGPEI